MNAMDVAADRLDPAPAMCARSNLDSSEFVEMAERLVVENFNSHRKPDRSPELSKDGVNMIWFTKGIIGYKAMFSSPLARGLIWEFTYNRPKQEMILDVYSKLNNTKVKVGDEAA
jgi:hypothetical protein